MDNKKKDFGIESAKIFNNMRNPDKIGNLVGKVIKPLPDLQISILDGSVILYPDQLYLNDFWFPDHTREYSQTGFISIMDSSITGRTTSDYADTSTPAYRHSHGFSSINISNGNHNGTGIRILTDTLNVGDLVKVSPADDEQTWFVDYKLRKVL